MQKGIFIRRVIISSIFIYFSLKMNAQKISLNRKSFLKDFVFKGNHIQFNFSPLSDFKANLEETEGNYPVNATATPGLLLGFKYEINFNNEYGLIIGPEAGLVGRNFNAAFNKNDFSPPLVKDYRFHGIDSYLADLILSFPVLFEKRMLYADTRYFFANAGLLFNISTSADFDDFEMFVMDVNNNFYNVASIDVYANNDATPWISIPVNAGHAWLLKNNNVMQLAITANISFTKYVNGTYEVDTPNKPLAEGRYSSTGSYIGLSMNYIFTNANYRIRKEYEKRKKFP